ncbi:MAG: metal ABC transporter ATP-binding protein [Methylacidiphilales bacterium]|nr:metal ABC transporter ATP-binding protein [Candidatus Methylacidiphilales bacterium]NJR16009.1 metal ABC transporter ATP-binding protein [Calothrix sp. CSU_2_0]
MLEVLELAVNYRGVQGLNQVSFHVGQGTLVGILGPNGAGKSTLFKAILGLIPAVSGTVSYKHNPLQQQLEKVAYVPQRSQIDWDYPITVENVVMMARTRTLGWFRRPGRPAQEVVKNALEQVSMFSLRDRRIGELSGGQQQRVFLARALAQQADLLIFDEPFAGVDVKTEAIILEVFAELRSQGKILLVSNHDWGEALTQLDRLLLLNQSLIADGSPMEVMTPENLQRAYGKTIQNPPHQHSKSTFFC